MENFIEQFDSLEKFREAVSTRKLNKVFADANLEASHDSGASFMGTETYEDAVALLENGDKESLQMLEAVNVSKLTASDHETRTELRRGIAGAFPCVPAYVAGTPTSMYQVKRARSGRKIVNIVASLNAGGSVDPSEFAEYGAKIASIVQSVERAGGRCNLYCAWCNRSESGQYCVCVVKLKDAGQPLNMLRMCFPLVNIGFKRRFMWRWLETAPARLAKSWAANYGYPSGSYMKMNLSTIMGSAKCAYMDFYDLQKSSVEEIVSTINSQM